MQKRQMRILLLTTQLNAKRFMIPWPYFRKWDGSTLGATLTEHKMVVNYPEFYKSNKKVLILWVPCTKRLLNLERNQFH